MINEVRKGVTRTPEKYFDFIKDFPYESKYTYIKDETGELRMAYIDEGNVNSDKVCLLMHGEPTWSYLYRHVIKEIKEKCGDDVRILVPDLIGFGKSDKYLDKKVYTYERCVNWLSQWFLSLKLNKQVYLFCQDW